MNTQQKQPLPPDMREDGTRWALLRGKSPEALFWAWGAREIVPVADSAGPLRSGGVFMLRFEDGWRYAHVDGQTSAWCDSESLGQLPSGECAWLCHLMRNARETEIHAQQSLAEAQRAFCDAQNAFALAVRTANQRQPDPDQGQPDPTN